VLEGETGVLVPLGDVDATTIALDKILSDTDTAAKMGIRAKEDIAERWNWDGYVSEIEQVYERVIG
jgi:glycosyltransferase involved in cell wall biosynthesis